MRKLEISRIPDFEVLRKKFQNFVDGMIELFNLFL